MACDGNILVNYFSKLPNLESGSRFIYEVEFFAAIEKKLIELIQWSNSDALSGIADDIEEAQNCVPASVISAIRDAVQEEFSEIKNRML